MESSLVVSIVFFLVAIRFILSWQSSRGILNRFIGSAKMIELLRSCGTPLKEYQQYPLIAVSGVVHSLVGLIYPFPPHVTYRSQIINTVDGGTLSLEWVESPSDTEATPTIVLVPGFEGGSISSYVKRAAHDMQRKGYRSVVINFRGYGGIPVTSGKYHNLSDISDLSLAFDGISTKFPKSPLIAVGYSMGANLLVKYLSEISPKSHSVIAAVSAGNPWDLLGLQKYHMSKSKFSQWWFGIYHRAAVWNIQRKVWR
eukprot:TRINITY_DN6849_c0_g1_i4.p1 TRINITY_DN6849_c0_g1~~TRINITY_DN6849_c0_g1_i4.p1  ORF type:complete len:256 (-),score=41.30 TRINITY_DN6849_c0_g1_i4:107-874(-)